jgi:hypothetical protein
MLENNIKSEAVKYEKMMEQDERERRTTKQWREQAVKKQDQMQN